MNLKQNNKYYFTGSFSYDMTFVISPSLQRIVKNHCPESCNYDCTERCSDDDAFKIKVKVDGEMMKYTCAKIPNSFVNCFTYDKKKKALVGEYCRASCGICP